MKKTSPLFLLLGILLFSSCGMFEANKPLRERLQGEWLLTTSSSISFDSLGNPEQDHKPNVRRHDSDERDYNIYTFQDSIMNIESSSPSGFHYELKDGEGADSILVLDYTRAKTIQRIGVTFPEEDRMKWHGRYTVSTPSNSRTTVEYVSDFIRIVRNK